MINVILTKIIRLAFMGLILESNVIAMEQVEKKEITPLNTTIIYYNLANQACTSLLQEYAAKGGHEIVPGFAHETVTAQDAQERVKKAFRRNILELGLHPGIPEEQWSSPVNGGLRGQIKFANHRLILKIRELYDAGYVLNQGVKLRDAVNNFDYSKDPYIDYQLGFVPKRFAEMNAGEQAYVVGLRETFDQLYPGYNNDVNCSIM